MTEQQAGAGRCVLRVQGLDCPSEVPSIRKALDGAPGVVSVGFTPSEGLVEIEYEKGLADPASLARRVAEGTGMPATPVPPMLKTVEATPQQRDWPREWLSTGLSGLALAVAVGLDYGGAPTGVTRSLYALAIAFAGFEITPRAWRALKGKRLGIHLLVTLAVAGALLLGEWGEAATVAFLFGLSEALESLSLARARQAVRAMLEVAPETADLLDSTGTTRTVPVAEVPVGGRVLVRSGMRVPVDGRVAHGRSSVDQKAITGESVPVAKEPGDEVFAGTVNGEGAMEVEATRAAADSLVSRTVELVREAQKSRTPAEQTVERFAAVYTPCVFVAALMLMIVPPLFHLSTGQAPAWRDWFYRSLVLLVTACPCALVIGTPVAVVCALAAAARRGVLVKGGAFLEAVGRLKVIAFDKTGTLTLGMPDVVEVVPSGDATADGLLRVAAAVGDRGGHPLGQAIARHARDLAIEVPVAADYLAQPGLGASARVDSVDYRVGSHRYLHDSNACDDSGFHRALGAAEQGVGTSVAISSSTGPIGYIRLADRPRPEASTAIAELHRLGLRTVMLTGDNAPTAASVASELGITDVRSGLLPGDKASIVSSLDRDHGPTGMIGDGVNDAPALSSSRVSFSLGGLSSSVALEASDIVLLSPDLSRLPWLVRLSRRTLGRIWQNIGLAIGTKVVVLGMAVAGYADLRLAIAADVGTTVVVVANALRLLRGEK